MIASHSSCRALADVPRNMTDDMIRALAKNGGVIGINYGSGFLDMDYRKRAEARKQPEPTGAPHRPRGAGRLALPASCSRPGQPVEPPPFERLIDHIDHAAKIAGVDHVGLGSDFDGVPSLPKGMEDVSRLPAHHRGPPRPRLQRKRHPQDPGRQLHPGAQGRHGKVSGVVPYISLGSAMISAFRHISLRVPQPGRVGSTSREVS